MGGSARVPVAGGEVRAADPAASGPEKEPGVVLAVAREGADRRSITAALTPTYGVRELRPEDLAEPRHTLDAGAAVVVLDAETDDEALGRLAPLQATQAGRSLVLLLRGVPDAWLEPALDRLRPCQVLSAPAADALIRFSVARALPSSSPGRGARRQQRPAPALFGVSRAIRGVLEQVTQIGASHLPALILGETGTGKELMARAIHEQSARAGGPFVAVNCGALPENLLESELFGHRKGAFTGAASDKRGLFEVADGGTLFLDEVGDTSPALQVKLLRALESGEVRPLGDTQERRVDVRLVSATNRDLEAEIERGSFRADLFYRINTATIHVPPLRRRRVDIPFLAQHFAEEFGAANARRITLEEEFVEALTRRDFPGNVRELRNAVERAIALADPDQPVTAGHLDSAMGPVGAPAARRGSLRERVEQVELEAIREALERFEGNRTRAAAALGLSRLGLRNKMRRMGLDEPVSR